MTERAGAVGVVATAAGRHAPTAGRTRFGTLQTQAIAAMLVLDALWGVLLVYRVPPLGGFDETWHFFRALQVAGGHFWGHRLGANDWGDVIDHRITLMVWWIAARLVAVQPISQHALRAVAHQLAAQPPDPQPLSFPQTASYAPLPYLPGAFGIDAARAMGGDYLSMIQAGRLASLAAYLGLLVVIVRTLPIGRLLALAILGSPTALACAASFNADPMNIALPALVAAWCLRLRLGPGRPPRWPSLAGLFALVVSLGLLKVVAVVFAGLVLLVPRHCFARAGHRLWFAAAALAGCCLVAAAWNLSFPFVPGRYYHTGADPQQTVRLLLGAPVVEVWRTLQAFLVWAGAFWQQSYGRFGGGPGAYHFDPAAGLGWAALAASLGLAVAEASERTDYWAALVLCGSAAVYVVVVLLAFRVAFNAPGTAFPRGIQGRYFIPAELLTATGVLLAVPGRRLGRFLNRATGVNPGRRIPMAIGRFLNRATGVNPGRRIPMAIGWAGVVSFQAATICLALAHFRRLWS